ncbi:MAG: diguanylate cyclase [Rhodocyclaceae bacterium]|nr:diguanylate cyclase [Rhodocyclaceae bacterium]
MTAFDEGDKCLRLIFPRQFQGADGKPGAKVTTYRPAAQRTQGLQSLAFRRSSAARSERLASVHVLPRVPAGQDGRAAAAAPGAAPTARLPRGRVTALDEATSLIVSADGEVNHCSTRAALLLGCDASAVVGVAVSDLFTDLPLQSGTPGYNLAYIETNFARGRWNRFHLHDRQGCSRAVEVSGWMFRISDSYALFMALRPLGEFERANPELARLIELDNASDEAMVITDAAGKVIHVNPAYTAMTGYSPRDLLGNSPYILTSPARAPEFYPAVWARYSQGGTVRCLSVDRKKSGELYFGEESVRPFVDADGKVSHFVCTQRDVGGRDCDAHLLVHLGLIDGLTGLPDRNVFLDRLRLEMAGCSRSGAGLTLVVAGIGNLNFVVRSRGQAGGDYLLREVASRLKHQAKGAEMVARIGEQEFAILWRGLGDGAEIVNLLAKLDAEVSKNLYLDGAVLPVSVRMGTATYPDHGKDENALLDAALSAMREAGRHGFPGWSFAGIDT